MTLMVMGVDLASAPPCPSGWALLDVEGRLVATGRALADDDLLGEVVRWHPAAVAIDAPLGLPEGLCCLEADCPCTPVSAKAGRRCEQQLAQRGIGCFYTTKRSIIKRMVYRGIGLRAALEATGVPVVEVYPYATKMLLARQHPPRKSTPLGLAWLCRWLAGLVPGVAEAAPLLDHNACDAIVAAYTALLHIRGQTEALGDACEGVLMVPAVLNGQGGTA
ncbi:MAG: DUF429 domain-containing protein [Chloroflexi bacterium]|nr:DUF429 domain-containing protein [Chloroflexota bacterium]